MIHKMLIRIANSEAPDQTAPESSLIYMFYSPFITLCFGSIVHESSSIGMDPFKVNHVKGTNLQRSYMVYSEMTFHGLFPIIPSGFYCT